MAQHANRREEKTDRHRLAISAPITPNDGLVVTCACGKPVTLRREQDKEIITLSDMLALLRVHINAEEWGITKNRAAPRNS